MLITGGTKGLGRILVNRFLDAGAQVFTCARRAPDGPLRSGDREAQFAPADVRDGEQVAAVVAQTVSAFGRLDVLVNNAGWTTVVPHTDLDGLTDDIFAKTFDVNVFGTWWLTKAAIPMLQQSDDPNVVTITSIAGVRPVGSSMAYSMAKAALNQMTVLLAKSYAPIRFNAVAPGLVATPWTESWDAQHAAVARSAPLKRSATPEDCAEATLGLLRMRYATGQIVVVDGGLTIAG